MNLTIIPLHRMTIDAITAWRYDPPYDLYNLDHPPTAEAIAYFLDPVYAYHEIHNIDHSFICTVHFPKQWRLWYIIAHDDAQLRRTKATTAATLLHCSLANLATAGVGRL